MCAGADRLVSTQDYFLEPEDSQHDGTDRTYNLRKINELPFHLLHAQLFSELKTAALLNFEWILAKLCGTSLRDLLEEYSMVIQVVAPVRFVFCFFLFVCIALVCALEQTHCALVARDSEF